MISFSYHVHGRVRIFMGVLAVRAGPKPASRVSHIMRKRKSIIVFCSYVESPFGGGLRLDVILAPQSCLLYRTKVLFASRLGEKGKGFPLILQSIAINFNCQCHILASIHHPTAYQ